MNDKTRTPEEIRERIESFKDFMWAHEGNNIEEYKHLADIARIKIEALKWVLNE